jgi:hypothetical protein
MAFSYHPASSHTPHPDATYRAMQRLTAIAFLIFLLSLLAIPGLISPAAGLILFFYGVSLVTFIGFLSVAAIDQALTAQPLVFPQLG